jgi:hypothetical protein
MCHPTRGLLIPLATALVLTVATTTFAAVPDAGAKMRGDFSGRGMPRSQNNIAPMIVRSAPAPTVAQTPTQRRSFSVEPSQPAVKTPCTPHVVPQPAPAGGTARQAPQTIRRYSVEPTQQPVFQAPMTRTPSNPPNYSLPKTDGRRFGSF